MLVGAANILSQLNGTYYVSFFYMIAKRRKSRLKIGWSFNSLKQITYYSLTHVKYYYVCSTDELFIQDSEALESELIENIKYVWRVIKKH